MYHLTTGSLANYQGMANVNIRHVSRYSSCTRGARSNAFDRNRRLCSDGMSRRIVCFTHDNLHDMLTYYTCRYIFNRQPGKALPFFLRLRRPNVFDLIRENNLFTAVQDQALLLVEFDQELVERRKAQGEDVQGGSAAISLLVDHTHSIPVCALVFNYTVHLTLIFRFRAWFNNCKLDHISFTCTWMRCSIRIHN